MPKEEKNKANRKTGVDTAIIVAIIGLVGTLVVGVLNSPVIIKFMERDSIITTTPPSDGGELVFNEDFEDQNASGFAFELGKWEIVKDKSNYVLKGVATEPEAPAAKAYFGSNDFADGTIEFRVKFLQSPGLYIDFRFDGDTGTYLFNFSPEYQSILLATNIYKNNDWQVEAVSEDSARSFTFQLDTWYQVGLELRGENITLRIDGNKILSVSDSRFSQGRMRFTLDSNGMVELDDIKVIAVGP